MKRKHDKSNVEERLLLQIVSVTTKIAEIDPLQAPTTGSARGSLCAKGIDGGGGGVEGVVMGRRDEGSMLARKNE